jgi:hypothetical protein
LDEFTRCTNAEHTHHDNGGAARDWKTLSIRPPLRGATALAVMPLYLETPESQGDEQNDNCEYHYPAGCPNCTDIHKSVLRGQKEIARTLEFVVAGICGIPATTQGNNG